ncbi:MAG: four helix bundle protein [Bacteroidales bacterium]|nr:four helix bundle protein [Bacteroidales bacterium]
MEKQDFIPSFFRFEDLRVYEKAIDYSVWVQLNTEMFPNLESNSLAKSFVLDSLELTLKIACGSSRNKVSFTGKLLEAKQALKHCVVHTTIARKLNYFSEEQEEESRNRLMELTKMIGALIGSLKENRYQSHHKYDEKNKNLANNNT